MLKKPRRGEAQYILNSREEILNFFKCIYERRFSEAERLLKAIEEKSGRNEFRDGYLNALNGLYLSLRAGDPRDFINRVLTETDSLEQYEKGFRAKAREYSGSPFDSGYFSALSDFIRYYINGLKGNKDQVSR